PPPSAPLFPTRRSSDLVPELRIVRITAHRLVQGANHPPAVPVESHAEVQRAGIHHRRERFRLHDEALAWREAVVERTRAELVRADRKSTRLNSSHVSIS